MLGAGQKGRPKHHGSHILCTPRGLASESQDALGMALVPDLRFILMSFCPGVSPENSLVQESFSR